MPEENKVLEATATLRFARISARKVKIVADLIRGKKVDEALAIVKFTPKAASEIVEKLLKSAIANAENNHGMKSNKLYVAEIYANQGPTMKAYGTVHKYGDNVDTDVIIPARYLNSSDPAELAKHCMEDIDKEFVNNVKAGDIIVAKKNFGCGSSREHAPIAIKAAGVSCVIAETFARIFYRNAINIGLPIVECAQAAKEIENGDQVEVDFDSGVIKDLTKGTEYQGQAFPEFMQKIIAAEGLVNYINQK